MLCLYDTILKLYPYNIWKTYYFSVTSVIDILGKKGYNAKETIVYYG